MINVEDIKNKAYKMDVYRIRVTTEEKAAFLRECELQGLNGSVVLRALMNDFIKQSKEKEDKD